MNRPSLLLPLLLVPLALAGGCAAPSYATRDWSAPEPVALSSATATPRWDGQPTSWGKLTEIEGWLEGSGRLEAPELISEAELQLAEGKLQLARRELDHLDPKLLTLRLDGAEAGFRRACARGDLRPDQEARVAEGLAALVRLRGGEGAGSPRAASAVRDRTSWGAARELPARLTRNTRPYSRITVHHSAKPTSELGSQSTAEVAQALRKIQLVHMRDRGFGDIGYHYLIDPQGRMWQGRPLGWQGAHSNGNNNVANIGICLLGDFDHERPTQRALASLEKLVATLSSRHRIPRSRVFGHDHWKPTACPGRGLTAWVDAYRQRATTPRTAQ